MQPTTVPHLLEGLDLFAADIDSFLCTAESADRRNLVARYRLLRHFK